MPLLFVFHQCRSQVQTVDDITKQVIPPSPQAASLGKYGNLPVNYHTGGVTVSIPLYEVKIGTLSLPLSLSYQTSGVRVTDVASRVGLGWTLQGEGVVTRTVRGMSDESGLGFYYLAGLVPYENVNQVSTFNEFMLLDAVGLGQVDSEPDAYNYNFMGQSGKFYIDTDNNPVLVPYNKIKFENNWKATMEDGTRCYFGSTETTQTTNNAALTDSYISAWYMTRVVTPRKEAIDFTYEASPNIEYGHLLSETDYYSWNGGSKMPARTVVNQTIATPRLKAIETRIEKVEFFYDLAENSGNGRLDLHGDYRLKKITITSKITNECIKEIEFFHTYVQSTATCNIPNFPAFPYLSSDAYRMRLDYIVERSCDGAETRKHAFEYDATLLPSRCSFAQDHWGFYNGADGNQTLKPYVSLMPGSYTYGDRSVNPAKLSAQSLTKITYPTKGYTVFEFEPHQAQGNYQGGQRIKSISDYSAPGVLAEKRSFTYANPLLFNPITEANYYYTMTDKEYPGGCGQGATYQMYDYVVRSSSNNYQISASQGSHIAYGTVTVSHDGVSNGKTVYEYTDDIDLAMNLGYPYAPPTSMEHRRGLLKREAVYDNNNTLLKETLSNYAFVPITTFGAYKIGLLQNATCREVIYTGSFNISHLIVAGYQMHSEWIQLASKTEKTYPGPEVNTTNLFYGNVNHLQVTRKETTRSDGRLDLEYMIYPDDYASGTVFIDSLKNRNIKNAVIEQVSGIADGAAITITGGKINKYSTTKVGHLSEIQFLELSAPIASGSYKFSNRATGVVPYQGTATTFSGYSGYKGNVFFDSYDNFGNITQFHTDQGINVSIKWGFLDSRPVVLVKNATPAEFFYEGFEETGGATGSNLHGGLKYRTTSYGVTFTKPNTRNYVLSFYKLSSGVWTLDRSTLSVNNPTVNPGVNFDDIFIYPDDAEFRIINYDPKTLLPVNETNTAHTIQYYTFDGLQRLQSMKDFNKDIVSSFYYHYKAN